MALNLNGTYVGTSEVPFGTIQLAISANNNTVEPLRLDSTGILHTRYNPFCYIYDNTGSGGVAMTNNASQKILARYAVANVGSVYNFTTNRFTAPIEGFYLIYNTGYFTVATTGNYIDCYLSVNGTFDQVYRRQGYGITGGYSLDHNWSQVRFLNPGDYVEIFYYSGGTGNTAQPGYSNFAIVYLG